ncbi:unnamed protein product [Trichogramma brassicae]|uniref:Homeobox domain-containing protein n=1 Tax=Trichogramma brassicae TaxID=86971 RepID=A0A6H5IPG7_9HYME|nr:unnamed protein product [Trichogramma brassicae]
MDSRAANCPLRRLLMSPTMTEEMMCFPDCALVSTTESTTTRGAARDGSLSISTRSKTHLFTFKADQSTTTNGIGSLSNNHKQSAFMAQVLQHPTQSAIGDGSFLKMPSDAESDEADVSLTKDNHHHNHRHHNHHRQQHHQHQARHHHLHHRQDKGGSGEVGAQAMAPRRSVTSWHEHVYAPPPRTPTPHRISDILGWSNNNNNNNTNNNNGRTQGKLLVPTPRRFSTTSPLLRAPLPVYSPLPAHSPASVHTSSSALCMMCVSYLRRRCYIVTPTILEHTRIYTPTIQIQSRVESPSCWCSGSLTSPPCTPSPASPMTSPASAMGYTNPIAPMVNSYQGGLGSEENSDDRPLNLSTSTRRTPSPSPRASSAFSAGGFVGSGNSSPTRLTTASTTTTTTSTTKATAAGSVAAVAQQFREPPPHHESLSPYAFATHYHIPFPHNGQSAAEMLSATARQLNEKFKASERAKTICARVRRLRWRRRRQSTSCRASVRSIRNNARASRTICETANRRATMCAAMRARLIRSLFLDSLYYLSYSMAERLEQFGCCFSRLCVKSSRSFHENFLESLLKMPSYFKTIAKRQRSANDDSRVQARLPTSAALQAATVVAAACARATFSITSGARLRSCSNGNLYQCVTLAAARAATAPITIARAAVYRASIAICLFRAVQCCISNIIKTADRSLAYWRKCLPGARPLSVCRVRVRLYMIVMHMLQRTLPSSSDACVRSAESGTNSAKSSNSNGAGNISGSGKRKRPDSSPSATVTGSVSVKETDLMAPVPVEAVMSTIPSKNSPVGSSSTGPVMVGTSSNLKFPTSQESSNVAAGVELNDDNDAAAAAAAERKKKKARTTFTGRQIFELEKQFEVKKYLSSSERAEMAKLLNVTETQTIGRSAFCARVCVCLYVKLIGLARHVCVICPIRCIPTTWFAERAVPPTLSSSSSSSSPRTNSLDDLETSSSDNKVSSSPPPSPRVPEAISNITAATTSSTTAMTTTEATSNSPKVTPVKAISMVQNEEEKMEEDGEERATMTRSRTKGSGNADSARPRNCKHSHTCMSPESFRRPVTIALLAHRAAASSSLISSTVATNKLSLSKNYPTTLLKKPGLMIATTSRRPIIFNTNPLSSMCSLWSLSPSLTHIHNTKNTHKHELCCNTETWNYARYMQVDQRIEHKQEKLNACMGALAGALTTLLTRKNDDDLLMIEALSDASRLLVDTIHDESLATTEIDGQLFGKNLSEVMKQAQATGKDVRTLAKKNAIPTNVSEKASKNEKGPSRHLSRKQTRTSNGQRPAAAARDHPRWNDKERPTTQRNKSSYTRSSTKKH